MPLSKVSAWPLALVSAVAMLGSGALGAQTPSQAILVAGQGKNPGENALLIVDPAARKVVARIPLSGQPHNIAVSPDGKTAYTSNALRGTDAKNYPGLTRTATDPDPLPSDTISVVDLQAQKEVHTVKVGAGANPHGIWYAAGKVYFTLEGNKTVGRYDPEHDLVDWIAGVGQNRVHELVVTRDGLKIFTANIGSDNAAMLAPWDPAFDHIAEGERPLPWNVTLIPTGPGAEGIALSADEKEVWIVNGGDATVSVIDVATRKVVQTVSLNFEEPLRITITPDGKRALVPSRAGEVAVIDTKTRNVIKRIPKVGTQIHGIVVSPDNSFAYTASQGEAEITVIDMKSFTVVGRIPTGTGKKAFDGIDGIAWAQRQ